MKIKTPNKAQPRNVQIHIDVINVHSNACELKRTNCFDEKSHDLDESRMTNAPFTVNKPMNQFREDGIRKVETYKKTWNMFWNAKLIVDLANIYNICAQLERFGNGSSHELCYVLHRFLNNTNKCICIWFKIERFLIQIGMKLKAYNWQINLLETISKQVS